jgi:hypothetical protein
MRFIEEKYRAIDGLNLLGRASGALVQEGEWSYQDYEKGAIYHHPRSGTRAIYGAAYEVWKTHYVRTLGYPISDFAQVPDTEPPRTYMDLEKGILFWETVKNDVYVSSKPVLGPIPAMRGVWEIAFDSGAIGVHAALLPTNKILFWSDDQDGPVIPLAGTFKNGAWAVLDLAGPATSAKKQFMEKNIFCSGQCLLGDGRALVVGGDRGSGVNNRAVHFFDPAAEIWAPQPDLPDGRWYPTVVTWTDSHAVVLAGDNRPDPNTAEPNSTAQFWPKGASDLPIQFDAELKLGGTYPFVFVLPDGRLFFHLHDKTRIVKELSSDESKGFNSATKFEDPEGSRTYPYSGTAVLLPLRPGSNPSYRARVLLMGGAKSAGPGPPMPAKASCVRFDPLEIGPYHWEKVKPMANPRVLPDAVLLPDGKVLVVNGSLSGQADFAPSPVYEAELYDPDKDEWTTMAPMSIPRLYHATALLMPDARVMTAGTDPKWNGAALDFAEKEMYQKLKIQPTVVEVFSPPYLFRGTRPQLTLCPEKASYGASFEIATPDATTIKSAVLIRNGSCTHAFNSDQRFVELEILKTLKPRLWIKWKDSTFSLGKFGQLTFKVPQAIFVQSGLQLKAPPTRFVAPPGYYMLFLLSGTGIPSVAQFLRLTK